MIKRNPALVIVFAILSCGIYNYYWIYVMTRDIEASLKKSDGACSQAGMAVVLSIITCGIYTYYWWFKEGKRVAQIQSEKGITVSDNSLVYIILAFLGISIVSMILLQVDINTIIDAPATPAFTATQQTNSNTETEVSGNKGANGDDYFNR